MTLTVSENPVDVAGQTRDIISFLADVTTTTSGIAPQLSEQGWAGLGLILLMVETELTKLTDSLEGKKPD